MNMFFSPVCLITEVLACLYTNSLLNSSSKQSNSNKHNLLGIRYMHLGYINNTEN